MNEDKPIILLIQETENKLLDFVNKSGLPAFFLHRIFQQIDNELQKVENQELSLASEKYEEKKHEKTKKDGEK